jgi:hypothetical protein
MIPRVTHALHGRNTGATQAEYCEVVARAIRLGRGGENVNVASSHVYSVPANLQVPPTESNQRESAVSAIWPVTDILVARWQAMRVLDGSARAALVAGAARWCMSESLIIERTDYSRVYDRTPSLGGHWSLFGTSLTDSLHLTATMTVALEFDGDRPVDLWVSGVRDVVAGGCTIEALAEALEQCGGPLRQITPISFGTPTIRTPQLSTLALDTRSPTITMN